MADGRQHPGNRLTMVMFSWLEGPSLININKNAFCKPRYHLDEVLYLKEPYKTVDPPVYIEYAFDHPHPTYESGMKSDFKRMGYSNKLYMPADFARQFIQITGVRCERLFDISDIDCLKEGIHAAWLTATLYQGEAIETSYLFGYIDYMSRDYASYDRIDHTPKESFLSLYKFANGVNPKREYQYKLDNIWVWVYEFKYLKDYRP